MMTKAHRQEAMSLAYLQAILAQAGFSFGQRSHDYGIDLTAFEVVQRDGRFIESGAAIEIQLRTQSGEVIGENTVYDMDVRTYDVLRERRLIRPRILVLLMLPESDDHWTSQSEEGLTLRRCAYWLSLAGQPTLKNRNRVRLKIPRTQILSVETIARLFDKVNRGEPI